MFTILTGCQKCPDAECRLMRHEDITLDIKFDDTMNCEQFIDMMNKYNIARYYFQKHFIAEDILEENNKECYQISNELEILKREGPSRSYKFTIRSLKSKKLL